MLQNMFASFSCLIIFHYLDIPQFIHPFTFYGLAQFLFFANEATMNIYEKSLGGHRLSFLLCKCLRLEGLHQIANTCFNILRK
jgi:hypothetical protein